MAIGVTATYEVRWYTRMVVFVSVSRCSEREDFPLVSSMKTKGARVTSKRTAGTSEV